LSNRFTQHNDHIVMALSRRDSLPLTQRQTQARIAAIVINILVAHNLLTRSVTVHNECPCSFLSTTSLLLALVLITAQCDIVSYVPN